MSQENKKKENIDLFFIITLFVFIFSISLFNYIVDPYYIFRDSSIKGFNDIKPHKYTNKRTVLYSDIKINKNRINKAFVGNCLIGRTGSGKNDIGFYTIPFSTAEEVKNIIININKIAPHIKHFYWGIFFQDLWFDENDDKTDTLPQADNTKANLRDYLNLFFSWNTTKHSIETVIDSIKNKRNDIYIYPYKEIAIKSYDSCKTFENMQYIKDVINFAKDKGIDVTIYYSPMHISKKVHMFEKNVWEKDLEFKKRLADITPFYDYSLNNEYNTELLDENSVYFIDNVHTTYDFNNKIVEDLLSEDKKLGVLITKENADNYLKKDTLDLLEFINTHKDLANKIKNLTKADADIKYIKSKQTQP